MHGYGFGYGGSLIKLLGTEAAFTMVPLPTWLAAYACWGLLPQVKLRLRLRLGGYSVRRQGDNMHQHMHAQCGECFDIKVSTSVPE
jgi:hypothetical protein